MSNDFIHRKELLLYRHQQLITKPNTKVAFGNGLFFRYENPILTAEHVPLNWRYDFNESTNPYLLERIGVNTVFNAGAIKFNGKYIVVARVEGYDRKSYFAIAESHNGIDHFTFWDKPIELPLSTIPDINVYDMRLVLHEDGWIYGIFCTERKDSNAPEGDTSSAIAACGIVRTKDLKQWERLTNVTTPSPQQRNVVLHPTFVNGKYAFYTRPQDGFIDTGKAGGIGFGTVDDITNAVITNEIVFDNKQYHTVYEMKNGLGPQPLKTKYGWLHLAHGVRNTAAGLRYVLYMFMTSLDDITHIIYKPAGYFMAPEGEERIGDVSNVLFCNGWIKDDNGTVFIYYASSDTRLHVATSNINVLCDYVMNTPPDKYTSQESVKTIYELIKSNQKLNK